MLAVPDSRSRVQAESENPSLDALYESEFDNIWRLLQRLGVTEPNLEDAVHEVFVAAHARLDTFDTSRSMRPWVFGIAVRVAGEMRRRARRDVPLPEAIETQLAEGTTGPEQQAMARTMVRRALDQLDFDQRAVLVMHDIEGFSAPEIAATLAAPLNTIYSRLRLARAKMSSLFGVEGVKP